MRRIARVQTPLGFSISGEAARCRRLAALPLPRRPAIDPSRTLRPCRNVLSTTTLGRSFSVSASALRDETKASTDVAAEADEADDTEDAASATPIPAGLAIPGAVETAPMPSNVDDPSYVPAQSGEGLEEVGGIDNWWEEGAHWDRALEFRGFGPAQRVLDAAALEVLARQAVLEALAVRESSSSNSRISLTQAWSRGGADARREALSLEVDVAEDGSVRGLRGDVAGVAAGLEVVKGVEAEEEAVLEADEARELVGSWDGAWKQISLDDAALKFAITKRILQLTGHLLPDAHLVSVRTVEGLLATLVRPPKAKSVAEELETDGTLASLPNVSVYNRRVTPIDKHKEVGRWKVIVHELEKRGLPATGTGGHDKSVERKWAFR